MISVFLDIMGAIIASCDTGYSRLSYYPSLRIRPSTLRRRRIDR